MSRARKTKAKVSPAPKTPAGSRDPRLPPVGGALERVFKGRTLRVEVTETGFRHDGKDWASLTALALHVTGYGAVSGPAFFGLTKASPKPKPLPAPESPPAPAKHKPGRPITPRRPKEA